MFRRGGERRRVIRRFPVMMEMMSPPAPEAPREAPAVPVKWLSEGAPGGPAVAVIPGFLESDAIWSMLRVDRIAPGTRAVALPLPGHHPWALSEAQAAPLFEGDRLVNRYAAALRAAFGGEPVRVIGHSTGALLALELARVAPELVRDVLAVAPLCDAAAMRPETLSGRIATMPVLGALGFRLMLDWWLADERRFARGLGTVLARDATGFVPMAMRADLRRSTPGTMRQVGLWLMGRSFAAGLAAVEVPATLVICSEDRVVPPAHQLEVLRGLPRGRAVMMGSGHLPMLERPEVFAAIAAEWLGAPAAVPGETAFGAQA